MNIKEHSIIWTPFTYGKSDFQIKLDSMFVKKILKCNDPKLIDKITRIGMIISEECGMGCSKNPYIFYDETLFLMGISLGYDRLSLDISNIRKVDTPEKYSLPEILFYNSYCNNQENSWTLLRLFGKWANETYQHILLKQHEIEETTKVF